MSTTAYYWSHNATRTKSETVGGVTPKTLSVSGTLSSVEAKVSFGSFGRKETFEVIKGPSTTIGTCRVEATCTITVSPNTVAAGETVVVKAVASSSGAPTASWTSI